MVGTLLPWLEQRFLLDTAPANAGGHVYTYESDGSTPKATYTDVACTVPHSNPIVLDAEGRPPADVFLADGGYTFIVKDANDVLLYTVSNIGGSGTATITSSQTLENTQAANVGNIGSGEDTLMTWTIPGATLKTDGDAVQFEAFGSWAVNGNEKRIRVRWGASVIFDIGAGNAPYGNNQGWWVKGIIVRRNGTSQVTAVTLLGGAGAAVWTLTGTAAETLASDVVLSITAEGTDTDDIVCLAGRVTYEPAAV